MKKIKRVFLIIIFLFAACSDGFNPFGDFEEKYLLYSILDRNAGVQYLTIRKSIPGNEITSIDTINASVSGAVVKITAGDSLFIFTEFAEASSVQSVNPSYYYSNFVPQKGETYAVGVSVDEKKFLTGTIVIPNYNITRKYFHYINLDSDEMPPRLVFDLEWDGDGENTVFLPRAFLNYYNIMGNDTLLSKKEIPLHLVLTDAGLNLSYPSFTSGRLQRFGFEGFEYVVDELASQEEETNILFKDFSISLFIMSEEYSRYYNSLNVVDDGISIREIPAKFSNISGGGGLFGYKETISQKLVSSYLNGLIAKAGFKIAK